MDSTTCMSTPPEEVDGLISMVAEEAGLQLSAQFESPGSSSIHASNSQANASEVDPAKDLEARLAALRG